MRNPSDSAVAQKRPLKVFERLLDTDIKADLLTLFHNYPGMSDSPEGLAKRVGRSTNEVQRELDDLVMLGALSKTQVYSFGTDWDREIQDAISKQLVLGEAFALERAPQVSGEEVSPARISTGLEVLDKVLPDGLPTVCTTLVLGDPGTGHENLIAHFVGQHLKRAQTVLYVTLDNFPANIRQFVDSQLTPMEADWSNLVFVDCYSGTVGKESEEPVTADPEDLSAISIAMSSVMNKSHVSLVILDSFNTLIRKRGYRSGIEFLRVVVARARQSECLTLVTMNRKAFHPAMVASAEDTVDGVIELKIEEGAEELARSLRVFKLAGTKHVTSWVPYRISDDGVFVPLKSREAL